MTEISLGDSHVMKISLSDSHVTDISLGDSHVTEISLSDSHVTEISLSDCHLTEIIGSLPFKSTSYSDCLSCRHCLYFKYPIDQN